MEKQFLTIAETKRILRISRPTLMNLLAKGEIRAVKVGYQWRIPVAELDRYAAVQPLPFDDPLPPEE